MLWMLSTAMSDGRRENIQRTALFRVPASRHRWLPTECGGLTFRPRDAMKTETAKIRCHLKYAKQMFFLDSLLSYESSQSLFLDLGANDLTFLQQLWILSQYYCLILLAEKCQETCQQLLNAESDVLFWQKQQKLEKKNISLYPTSLLKTASGNFTKTDLQIFFSFQLSFCTHKYKKTACLWNVFCIISTTVSKKKGGGGEGLEMVVDVEEVGDCSLEF